MTPKLLFLRASSFVFAVGAALAIVLGALQSTIWNGIDAPAAARLIASVVEPELATTDRIHPSAAYFAHGRLTVAIYALLLLGWRGLASVLSGPGYRATLALVGVAGAGDLIAYWLSSTLGPAVRRIGFWYIEVPALGALAGLLTVVGIWRVVRQRRGRRLVLAVPAAVLGTMALRYLPHGALAGIATVGMLASVATFGRAPIP